MQRSSSHQLLLKQPEQHFLQQQQRHDLDISRRSYEPGVNAFLKLFLLIRNALKNRLQSLFPGKHFKTSGHNKIKFISDHQ
jgi:hypothetical protein